MEQYKVSVFKCFFFLNLDINRAALSFGGADVSSFGKLEIRATF